MNGAPTANERAHTLLLELSATQCADLLAASTLGRLGVVVHGRPEIFPVNHVYDRESGVVSFPTKPGTKLEAALDWPWVAFEVDGEDPDGRSGWSVLVVGRAEVVTDAGEASRAAAARTARWGGGPGTRWVRIVPSKVTGRRIEAVGR